MTVAPARDREVILAELATVAAELAATNQRATDLYEQRLALLQEGRRVEPKPITQRELAATAGVTEEAVIQVLRKAARQKAAEPVAG